MDFTAAWNWLLSFCDSNFFSALITLVVGLFAFAVYKQQKRDKKKDAANIIMQEIRNAEAQLTQAKEILERDRVIPESVVVMNTMSWREYGYLFIRDLTSEEWQLVDNFYLKCEEFDNAVKYNNSFFEKNEEQIRINLHSALSSYTQELLVDIKKGFQIEDEQEQAEYFKDTNETYENIIEAFHSRFMDNVTKADNKFFYRPNKPYEDTKTILHTVRLDISTSTIGIKLTNIVDSKRTLNPYTWFI